MTRGKRVGMEMRHMTLVRTPPPGRRGDNALGASRVCHVRWSVYEILTCPHFFDETGHVIGGIINETWLSRASWLASTRRHPDSSRQASLSHAGLGLDFQSTFLRGPSGGRCCPAGLSPFSMPLKPLRWSHANPEIC